MRKLTPHLPYSTRRPTMPTRSRYCCCVSVPPVLQLRRDGWSKRAGHAIPPQPSRSTVHRVANVTIESLPHKQAKYLCTSTRHLRVYLVLQSRQIGAQDANLLPGSCAEERQHKLKRQAEPRRSVDHERLVAALDVVLAGQVRDGLDVLLDLSGARLVNRKKQTRNEERKKARGGKGTCDERALHTKVANLPHVQMMMELPTSGSETWCSCYT